jgi:hypothetical protein
MCDFVCFWNFCLFLDFFWRILELAMTILLFVRPLDRVVLFSWTSTVVDTSDLKGV